MAQERAFTHQEYLADRAILLLSAAAALIGTSFLIFYANQRADLLKLVPLVIYGLGLVLSFSFSAAYNITLTFGLRRILRRLDHAAIFFLIAATYTPILLLGLGGSDGRFLALVIWSIATLGMVLKLFYFRKFQRLSFFLSIALGWIAVLILGPLITILSPLTMGLLVFGGLIYSFGIIFHLRDNWPYNRAIWHVHVLLGAACHYGAILLLMPK